MRDQHRRVKKNKMSISFGNPRGFDYICRHLTKKRSKGALLCLSQSERRITWLPQRERQLDKSTEMNSGKSFGKQLTSMELRAWLTKPLLTLTAGLFSAPKKCNGTLMVTGSFSLMRWKSMCMTCGLYGCIWKARKTTS